MTDSVRAKLERAEDLAIAVEAFLFERHIVFGAADQLPEAIRSIGAQLDEMERDSERWRDAIERVDLMTRDCYFLPGWARKVVPRVQTITRRAILGKKGATK